MSSQSSLSSNINEKKRPRDEDDTGINEERGENSSSSNIVHMEEGEEIIRNGYLKVTKVPNRRNIAPAKVITFYSHKGGVGKTTNCHTLAYTLSQERKKKVLMIDLDPQMNLSILATRKHWLGKPRPDIDTANNHASSTQANHAFSSKEDDEEDEDENKLLTWADIIRDTPNILKYVPNSHEEPDLEFVKCENDLYLLFGSDDVSDIEHRMITSSALLHSQTDNYYFTITRINRLIDRISLKFDFIIIDLSPSYNTMVRNVIGLSHGWILSCLADEFSIQAVDTMMDRTEAQRETESYRFIVNDNKDIKKSLEKIKKGSLVPEPRFKILGYILNRTRPSTSKKEDNVPLTKATMKIKGTLDKSIKKNKFYFHQGVENENTSPFICNFTDFTSVNLVSQDRSKPAAYVTSEEYNTKHNGRQQWSFDDSQAIWRRASEKLADRVMMI